VPPRRGWAYWRFPWPSRTFRPCLKVLRERAADRRTADPHAELRTSSWGRPGVRIVGGRFAGRDLASPNDFRVRPTAEPVRAALLDALASDLQDARVLDLFAGSGALGLEALSRGARSADFVEIRPVSLHALRANIAALRLRECTRVFKRDALLFAAAVAPDSYDLAFADPPYESRLLDRVLDSWRERRFARILAAEHDGTRPFPDGQVTRSFGDTAVTIFRL